MVNLKKFNLSLVKSLFIFNVVPLFAQVGDNPSRILKEPQAIFDGASMANQKVLHPLYKGVVRLNREDRVVASWVAPAHYQCINAKSKFVVDTALPGFDCKHVSARRIERHMMTDSYKVENRDALIRSQMLRGAITGLIVGLYAGFVLIAAPYLIFQFQLPGWALGIAILAAMAVTTPWYMYSGRKFAKSVPKKLEEVSYHDYYDKT